jgi:hypothetical protein
VYAFAYDRASSSLVGLQAGDGCTDADYQRIIDSSSQLWAEASAAPFATFVHVVDPGQEAPSPSWRRRLADSRPATLSLRNVIVTSSFVHRGVLTAINWLRPPAPGQKIVPLATFEAAVAWVEAERGGQPFPILRTLYAKARDQLLTEHQGASSLASASRLRAGRVITGTHEPLPKKTSTHGR